MLDGEDLLDSPRALMVTSADSERPWMGMKVNAAIDERAVAIGVGLTMLAAVHINRGLTTLATVHVIADRCRWRSAWTRTDRPETPASATTT